MLFFRLELYWERFTNQLTNLWVIHFMERVFFWTCVRANIFNLYFPSYAMFYYSFYFSITLFPSWNFFCTGLVFLSSKHSRYISVSQKSAWWKSADFFVNFFISKRIVDTSCISKEKALHQYVNVIVKSFKESF